MGIFWIVIGMGLCSTALTTIFAGRKQPQKKDDTSTLGLS
jgi:xanthine/uracil permease